MSNEKIGAEEMRGVCDALGQQMQVDHDGMMCGVSREATDKAIAIIRALAAEREQAEGEAVAWMDSGSNRCSRVKHPGFILPQPLYLHPPAQQSAVAVSVTDDLVLDIIAHVCRENSIDGMDGDSWDQLLVRGALEFVPLLRAGVPDGMVLVTRWKLERAASVIENDGDEHGVGADIRAMLAARPTQPKESGQ